MSRDPEMHAAHDLNGPVFAHAITATRALLDELGAFRRAARVA